MIFYHITPTSILLYSLLEFNYIFLVILYLKIISSYPIQTKTIILNLLLKYVNQTQITSFNSNYFKSDSFNFIHLKIISLKVKPNRPLNCMVSSGVFTLKSAYKIWTDDEIMAR